jgi:hypothetical protein
MFSLNNPFLARICEANDYHLQNNELFLDQEPQDKGSCDRFVKLTREQVFDLFSQSREIIDRIQLTDYRSSYLRLIPGCGSRPLINSNGFGYFKNPDEVKAILLNIRYRTCKSRLNILDIGGYIGKALRDLQLIDPNTYAYNLTLDIDPNHYPFNELVFGALEYMPKEFEEKMDLVLSLTTFVHCLYPDIGLLNTVKSLSIGGHAHIAYKPNSGIGKYPIEKTKTLYERLKELENNDYLLLGNKEDFEKDYWNFIDITKLKSTKGIL